MVPDATDQQAEAGEIEESATHVPIAERLSLVSWDGGRSAPSLPSVDEGSSEDGSMLDSDSVRSSTMSVSSSIYHFVEENGRTYHRYKEGKYFLPNDQQERDRLDLQHALCVLTTQGKLFLAPLDNPKHILDIATGTGIWAIELAQQFPNAHIVGTDLSPIQPEFLPANCRFEIDDAEDEWSFSQKFDFIHGRALVSCFKDPSHVIRQAYENLVPGGYLELQDAVFPMEYLGEPPVNSALYQWNDLLVEAAARAGRRWTNVPFYKRWMEETGFEDIVVRNFFWPMSPWAKGQYYKTIALYAQGDFGSNIEGISLKLFGFLGWDAERIKKFANEVQRDIYDTSIHAYLPIIFLYGRKPLNAPTSS
ncbi:S-adenosyl-L-methionine-dependent methyltransferase [Thozetella sp. PMI_491]|nr:S-adenosyl-L-methionine-dependent methyltransferase [Thozetella sp. PMI_491]